MEDKPLYNSRVIITYLEYLKHTHPNMDLESLLTEAGISPIEVQDEGNWLTQKQVDSFHDALMKKTHDPSLSRAAGRFMASSKSLNALRQFALGFLTPIQAYIMAGKTAPYINRGAKVQAKKINRSKVEIITKPNNGVHEKLYQCENRMGTLEAMASLFINKLPTIEHPECIHQGGSQCRYIISWEEPAYLKWRRFRNYLTVPYLIFLIICVFLLSPLQYMLWGFLLAGILFGMTYYALYIEKRDITAKIQNQSDMANRLLDQITIGNNNALLVQEIGQAVSNILDVDKLMKFVMETLQKRLNFDRGMIMLANPDKTRLVYMSGYGYSPEMETILKETQFHLNNPRSKGPFVIAYKEQKPFITNDINVILDDISPRSYDFAKMLDVSSFICVPIVYEGKSEGILAVDNYRSHRPHNQNEVSLLMGIAPQIAISINNAKSLRQIMENEERFRTLSENSPDIIYTTDNAGFITYINPAAEEILGCTTKEMLGHPFTEFAMKEDATTFDRLFNRVEQGKDTIKNFEAKLLAKDGTERLFYMSGAPNFNAIGEMMGVVGILKDFTEQRKLEQQLHHASRMNAIGRLTGGISHDFNNILQAINAYNQLLTMKKTDDDPDWKYLMNIHDLTKRATDLVGQLLIFSRKVESKLEPIDVNAEIRNFYELLVSTLPKAITLQLDLADNLHLVNGDEAQLGQVIMNLTVNAKDAMPEGGNLRIETKNIEFAATQYRNDVRIDAGRYIMFRVSDTGCGIATENLNHIFEPFFTTKEAGKGTGIGLSVVYGIVKNHNGFIFCSSKPGLGTVFEIYLPTLDIEIVEKKKEPLKKTDLLQGQETILLVDDEPSLLDTGQELLSLLGYHVLTAKSGENALSVINRERENIALVILDLMMPGMGGEKCLPEILKIIPSMKVIIASGYTANIKTEEIISAGAADFIRKPYHIEVLSKKIRGILDQVDPSS
jgi:PAS domain S-box-containing protein